MEARQRTWPFVPPDARQNLQAKPRGKETRPSKLVLQNESFPVLRAFQRSGLLTHTATMASAI